MEDRSVGFAGLARGRERANVANDGLLKVWYDASMSKSRQNTAYWAIGVGAIAAGGLYWYLTRKKDELVQAAPLALQTEPLALQTEPLAPQTDVNAGSAGSAGSAGGAGGAGGGSGGASASFADGSGPAWPDLSGLSALFQPQGGSQGGMQLGANSTDKFIGASLYSYDPWHPEAFAINAEGLRQLASAPLNAYVIDRENAGAVIHSMSASSISSARMDNPHYNAPATAVATANGGRAVYFSKADLDAIAAGNAPSTLLFGTAMDAAAWLSSPNGAMYNVRLRPSNEGLPPVYTGSTATPYGVRLFNDNLAKAVVWKTYESDPVGGATRYTTATPTSTAEKSAAGTIAAAQGQGRMIYADATDMDALARGTGTTVDFIVVWPGTAMPSKYVSIS